MRMTALDIQNHAFPRRTWMGGYDVDEVEQFRTLLVEDWAALNAEADELRRRVATLEARVDEMSAQEKTLRDALVTAQGLTDDLRRTAEREAQMRVGAAEIQAEKILAAAHGQASRLAHDVRELRALRSRVSTSVRATIETHLALLESFSRDPDELDEAPPARLAAYAEPPPEIETSDQTGPDELFGPPGPPSAREEAAETEAALADALAESDAEGSPQGTLGDPERQRPAPPSQGWRTFFGQG